MVGLTDFKSPVSTISPPGRGLWRSKRKPRPMGSLILRKRLPEADAMDFGLVPRRWLD